jgi:HAD superfamily hydrolase (TIGR01509 family)
VKIICFDIGNVLLKNCSKRMFWQLLKQPTGLRNLIGYLLFDPNRFRVTRTIRAKMHALFDHLAHTEGVEQTNGRYPTEQGRPVSNSIQQWQRGQITRAQLMERIKAGLDVLPYTSRYEQRLAALVALIVLTPELHAKTKTVVPGMQKLISDLSVQPVTLVIISNIDAGLAPQVRKRFPELFGKFETFFESHAMGIMKPNPEFFRAVVQHYGVPANQIFVIDDLTENIAAAHSDVGCQVFHFNNNADQLRSFLQHREVLP